tara:strand:- start:114 stop:1151 length:1038 start_codon:yes stop_codon:yes gene_type:complete
MKFIKYNQLLKFSKNVLKKSGVNSFCAKYVSEGLCNASLRGTDSHGINLLPHYVSSAIHGRKNPRPKFKFYKRFNSTYLLDADNGYGISAGIKAIEKGCQIAKKNGICSIGVINSSHPGALASIALHGVNKGYTVFAFTHADSLQLTFGGRKPYFGTNPICFASPGPAKKPFCLDMATTNINWNKLLNYRRLGKKLLFGTAVDKNGKITTNPNVAECLTSIGGYKGFGLAAMIEILCSIFLGMRFGSNIPPMYKSSIKKPRKLGQFYIVLRTDSFVSKKNFINNLGKMSKQIRKQKTSKKKDKIYLPNDVEYKTERKRNISGIPVDKDLFIKLKKMSEQFQIKLS